MKGIGPLWRQLRTRVMRDVHAADNAVPTAPRGDSHSLHAVESLRALLDDAQIPASIRAQLAAEFTRLEAMLAKLERGELHIAVFGRVSVGKSALANALRRARNSHSTSPASPTSSSSSSTAT